ncbi:NADPH-dependent FMN reductase [Piscibacillus salipiscarius]|uniref:NADPH-dependent FMN reductase n=1 Tax=Piscibacillus salipiscarius TaxID=299480 RepID=A0ABW5Q848_9BACI|nr:NADPH-dependent FMN reductase [Piscibacillus salipiscarius]
MKILLINGTVAGEKTKHLLKEAEKHLTKRITSHQIETLYLEDFKMEFADGRPKDDYNEDTKKLIDMVEHADGYIIATPVFQGSIPGALKNMFDLVSPKCMRYKPVALMGNGGTFQHHLVIENQLKPILDYFRCLTTPNYVYTHSAHFSETKELVDEDVKKRIKDLSEVFVKYLDLSQDIKKSTDL